MNLMRKNGKKRWKGSADNGKTEHYRIKYSNGVVKYLDGIVLRERNEDESTEV